MTEERFSLKDHLFNREKVSYLGDLLSSGIDGFDRKSFEDAVMAEMLDLELKERIALIARVLSDHLDPGFAVAASQIERSLPPPLDPNLTDDDFGDFIIAPFGKYVEEHGLAHFEVAIGLLRQITMRFSMEGSIRPFINAYPDRTLKVLETWAHDDNYHVRRLVSEGTRPRLPWSGRIDIPVEAPLPLLDILHADSTRYVTRSVANHLNDIAKVEPDLVLDRLAAWKRTDDQDREELAWMTKHALRTLIKDGHPEAMRLLGFEPDADVNVVLTKTSETVKAGEALVFEATISSDHDEQLLVDYSIDFVKKNGDVKPKVFKLKSIDLDAGETAVLVKSHQLRANATTYRLYPGEHRVTVMVNGRPTASAPFEVIVPE